MDRLAVPLRATSLQVLRLLSVCLLLCLPAHVRAQSDSSGDSLLKALQKNIDGKVEKRSASNESPFVLESIKILPAGTNLEWVRSQLLFHAGEQFTMAEWKRTASLQRSLLLDSQLYYDARVYLLPGGRADRYRAVIQLSDGFPFGFFFWPWDASVTWKHMLGGDEALGLTLGLNTQGLDWTDPVVRRAPIGYEVGFSHFLRYRDPGWIENGLQGDGRILLSTGPAVRVGAEVSGRWWTLPTTSWLEPGLSAAEIRTHLAALGLAANGEGSALDTGGFFSLWPSYQFQRPFGVHLDGGAGFSRPIGPGPAYGGYLRLNGLLFVAPLSRLLAEVAVHVAGRPGTHPAVLFPDTSSFRSPRPPAPCSWFTSGSLEIMGRQIVEIPLGFTTMSLSPMAYLDIAETSDGISAWNVTGIDWATGGGVIVGFATPINLYFTLGAKASLVPAARVGFLFAASKRLF